MNVPVPSVGGRPDPDPEQVSAAGAPASAEIPAATRLGAVHLTVSDLARSVEFYERSIGLTAREVSGDVARLGVAEHALLVLHEQPGAGSSAGYTGLFHFALLLPERGDLAAWLEHAAATRVPLTGLSDHFVSEAIYLDDPDGHGIEIYWDRPREVWEGRVAERMTTLPLDVDSLLGEAPGVGDSYAGMPAGTTMGHVHLKVADVEETVGFYRDVLGLGLMAQLGPSAAFLSAGGYHHHVGANVWQSAGAPPPPSGTASLRHATMILPSAADLDPLETRLEQAGVAVEAREGAISVADPSGNHWVLTSD